MADTRGSAESIFRQSAMSRIANIGDLDKYIKVANPNPWVVLLAAVMLLGGLAIWAATAVIPITTNLTGMASGSHVVCWVDEGLAGRIEEGGAYAIVEGELVTEVSVVDIPLSYSEVKARVGERHSDDVSVPSGWSFEVAMDVDDALTKSGEPQLVSVDIVVLETHPLNLVFGGGQ